MLDLLSSSQTLIAVYDAFDRLRYANTSFRQAYFIDPTEEPLWSEVMRRNYAAGRGTDLATHDFEGWLLSTESRRGKQGHRAYETGLVGGRRLWMSETVLDDGWMLCVASDISALHTRYHDLREDRDRALKSALTDELTGIANRRFVLERLSDMLGEGQHTDEAAGAVAVLDLDNFKYINDRCGHEGGDAVLRDFAHRIQKVLRRRDCLGRIGGEEFVLVMPQTSLEHAKLIVERMAAATRHSRPIRGHSNVGYTFSAGIASAAHGELAQAVLARADLALYAAKMAGRNRIVVEGAGDRDPGSFRWRMAGKGTIRSQTSLSTASTLSELELLQGSDRCIQPIRLRRASSLHCSGNGRKI